MHTKVCLGTRLLSWLMSAWCLCIDAVYAMLGLCDESILCSSVSMVPVHAVVGLCDETSSVELPHSCKELMNDYKNQETMRLLENVQHFGDEPEQADTGTVLHH